jgi:Zn-dependent M28 family amino/carboxypeptidase
MIGMPGRSYRGELPPADDGLVLLANELRQDVKRFAVDIGERNVQNRPQQLAQAADAIEAEFLVAGLAVRRQEYEVPGYTCCNLEVEIPGSTRPEEIVIVGAHYDTVPGTAGANDNTSGVAAVLALSRRFAALRTGRTLRFVAFVNEEKPYAHTELMGSRVYARRCRERGEQVVAMMSLETIGYYDDNPGSQKYPRPLGLFYPSQGNFIAFIGNRASRHLVRQAVAAFRRHEPFPSEGAALPAAVPRIGDSDHASFWHEGYLAIMVTDTANFRYPYYHTPEDTIDKVDFDRLARVVRGLRTVVAGLAEASQK